jgi:hypothetical protein
MTAFNKQALLSTDKHANQHRLSRLTMEVHSDELRIMASAVESYTDELIPARCSLIYGQKSTSCVTDAVWLSARTW